MFASLVHELQVSLLTIYGDPRTSANDQHFIPKQIQSSGRQERKIQVYTRHHLRRSTPRTLGVRRRSVRCQQGRVMLHPVSYFWLMAESSQRYIGAGNEGPSLQQALPCSSQLPVLPTTVGWLPQA